MANPSNLLKRNYAYYWRRSLLIVDDPITLVLSLHTKVPTVARRRCALMTAKSEDVRMNLYARIRAEGIEPERRLAIFRAEMTEYRNALDHEVLRWDGLPERDERCSTESGLHIFRALWDHVATHRIPTCALDDRGWTGGRDIGALLTGKGFFSTRCASRRRRCLGDDVSAGIDGNRCAHARNTSGGYRGTAE